MARDYFQDIVPPGADDERSRPIRPPAANDDMSASAPESRSIRNINIARQAPPAARAPRQEARSRVWLWVLAGLCVVVLGLLALLLLFKNTSVTVVPHSQRVLFDQTSQFTAYPAATAASGTIPYTLQSTDIGDAEPVQSSGTQHTETKASGQITVFNNYSGQPLKLLAGTRFQTASGLVFRVPAAIAVPGKQGSTPGKITVTVAADKAGDQYNIAANQRLTLPGLQSNAAMYAAIYATTAGAMSGGFSGDAPAVSDSQMQSAKSAIEARLTTKAHDYAQSLAGTNQIVLNPVVTFSAEPLTEESGGSRLHETAHVAVPVIPLDQLSDSIAQAVTASADTSQHYLLVPGTDFAAAMSSSSQIAAGDPMPFTLSGSGTLVAQVDASALAQALVGRDQGAFQAIIANFPGVDSAKARIEPFWNSTFPKNPNDIHIVIQSPQNAPQ